MKAKILIIDDNKETVMSVGYALEREGFEVITAYDGQEGYLKAIEHYPDLLILDIMMPVMDGFSMNRHLKENPQTQDIPVIIITGKEKLSPQYGKTKETQVSAIVYKPFLFKTLLSKIKKALSEYKHP